MLVECPIFEAVKLFPFLSELIEALHISESDGYIVRYNGNYLEIGLPSDSWSIVHS